MPNKHKFKEHRFHSDGEINGLRMCVQEFKCEQCGIIIELPAAVKPTDYRYDDCQGGKNENTNKEMRLVQKGKWLSPDRKSGRPGQRV